MKNIFILVLFLCPLFTIGQSYLTVSGIVIDEESEDALIFASIGIKEKSIGTISNTIGEFDFHLPIEHDGEILEIHMLGYETFQMQISEILDNNVTVFRLKRISKFLEEVIVSDSLSGGDIYTIAVNRIDMNYPKEPYLMDAFYRDVKSVGGSYVALLEAAVKIYNKDYEAPKNKLRLRERVTLIEVRKSLGYDNKFTSFFDQTNLLEDLLLHNNVKYRQFPSDLEFINLLQRENSDFYDGRKVFVIQFRDSDRLKLYIDAQSFAIIRMEYGLSEQDVIIANKQQLYSKMGALRKIIDFKEYNGEMFLSHIDLVTDINWYDTRTDELKFSTKLRQELLINKVYPRTTQKIGTAEKMKRFGLQYQHKKYNKQFWDNYNVIKDTPLDIQIVTDLEKELSLEKQFSDN